MCHLFVVYGCLFVRVGLSLFAVPRVVNALNQFWKQVQRERKTANENNVVIVYALKSGVTRRPHHYISSSVYTNAMLSASVSFWFMATVLKHVGRHVAREG